MTRPDHVSLICSPTPEHRLNRLSEKLNAEIWIKRDDLTGFALGGNKGRKLEYLMPSIVASGATCVVTCGSRQSNFIRQLGCACRIFGIRCVAVVMDLPFEPPAPKPNGGLGAKGGNVVLDQMAGVEFVELADGSWDDLFEHAAKTADRLSASGEKVHAIPVGGSSVLGAYSFYLAASELKLSYDAIVVPSSSGSTQVGLAYAFAGTSTQVIGIACDPEPELPLTFAELAEELDALVQNGHKVGPGDFRFRLEWVGPGYGVPSEHGEAAAKLLLDTEGIYLDPVYSAKAFAGMTEMLERDELGGRVLFWHTGGLPALFAHS